MKHALWIAAVAIVSLHAPAQAGTCGKWQAEVSSLMGEGEEMNAHACLDTKKLKADYEIVCEGKKKLMVRFAPTAGTGDQDFSNANLSLNYDVDGNGFPVITQFEELDGAFVATFPTDHPLITAMQHGKKLSISDASKKLPTYVIGLTGSNKALPKLIKTCK